MSKAPRDNPFKTSRDSIAWVRDHHLPELKRKIDTFIDQDSYSQVTEIDPRDSTYYLVKLRLVKPIPPDFRGHTVDGIHNLRAALDQAIFSIASGRGPIYFPIRNTKADFNGVVKGVLSKRLPKEIIRLIRSFRPYKRGNSTLWALSKLDNTNKHAIIRPLYLAHGLGGMRGGYKGPRPPQFPCSPRWVNAKNEAVIARVPTDVKEFEMNYQSSFFIVFNKVQIVDGHSVVEVLDNCLGIVDSIVTALEAESKRIGLC